MTRYLDTKTHTATRAPLTRRSRRSYNNPAERPSNDREHRDHSYDARGNDNQESVYSPRGIIALRRSHGQCSGCGRDKDLLNDYCEDCHILGLNERQCMNSKLIAVKANNGRSGASQSPWRMKS